MELPSQVFSREAVGLLHVGKVALCHHAASVNSGPRTHVNDMVGMPHEFFVVLHHHHAVAQVAQLF